MKNCLPFVASAVGYIGNSDENFCGIEVRTYEDWGNFYADKELIGIAARGYGIGSWHLIKDSLDVGFTYYQTMQDHDVLEDIYDLDTSYKFNRMIITSIDTVEKKMNGIFEARFIISSSIPSGRQPDTLIFTNCHFEAREP